MADWLNITDTQVDPDAPLTSQLAYGWRDNVIAAREGAVNSPYERSSWHPYDGVTIGDGATGIIYDFAVHGAVASVTTPDFTDSYEYRLDFEGITSAATGLLVRLYRETSAARSGTAPVLYGASGYNLTGSLDIRDPRRSLLACHVAASFYNASGGGTVASAWINLTTAQKVLWAEVYLASPYIFSAGKIRMMRRLAF